MKPICYDLFCGLGGWSEAFIAEGYRCVGFDIEAHDYGTGGYPGELRIRDIRSIHGSELKDAAVIVASPPCQEYSYMAMPWSKAKAKQAAILADTTGAMRAHLTDLFNQCFRIQREAIEAAGHHIPLIVENVRGAQKWVGKAQWNSGSFYLWGDVPALMPIINPRKLKGNNSPRLWSERRIQRLCDASRHDTDAFYMAPSSSSARKAASALIAKIPFELARHIAICFKPTSLPVSPAENSTSASLAVN